MSNGSRPDSKGDGPLPGGLLKLVDDGGRVFRSVDIKPRTRSDNLDFHLRLLPGDQIDVGLVLSRALGP